MRLGDRDPDVRRLERDGVAALALMAVVALAVRRGNPDAAAGVLVGGLLAALSYWAIKSGVDALLSARTAAAGAGTGGGDPIRSARDQGEGADGRRRGLWLAWQGAKFIGRYALLALAAYVMLTRFRAHPVGVLCGVSAPVLAAAAQLPRLWRRGARLR